MKRSTSTPRTPNTGRLGSQTRRPPLSSAGPPGSRQRQRNATANRLSGSRTAMSGSPRRARMPTMDINGNLADVSSSTATFLNTLDLIVKKKRRRYANKTKVKWAFQVWCVYNKAVRIRTNLRIQVVSKAINNIRSCHAKLKAIALKQWQQVKNFDRLKKVYAEMQESKHIKVHLDIPEKASKDWVVKRLGIKWYIQRSCGCVCVSAYLFINILSF